LNPSIYEKKIEKREERTTILKRVTIFISFNKKKRIRSLVLYVLGTIAFNPRQLSSIILKKLGINGPRPWWPATEGIVCR
jgi:hypothetical protein